MAVQMKFVYIWCLILLVLNLTLASEFSAELDDSPLSVEDNSREDTLPSPRITNDMLSHKNPAIKDNALKDLWEKLPDYELTDIK